MTELVRASYLVSVETIGRKSLQPLNLTVHAGENVFLHGSFHQRKSHFEVLCGLIEPDMGNLFICGQSINVLDAARKSCFRRDHIGGIPFGGGFFPEVPLLEQIILPLTLRNTNPDVIQSSLVKQLPIRFSLSNLLVKPQKCPSWKVAYAAVFRAMLCQPKVVIINGLMDEMDEVDADALWEYFSSVREKDSVLLYLGGGQAPRQITWSRKVRLE